MAFLVICVGITILQMSKVDPVQLNKLDRRSTILLQAARSQTETADEKVPIGLEDPGMDALRGSFGTFGSIIRAKSVRRMSQSSGRGFDYRSRPPGAAAPYTSGLPYANEDSLDGLKRHQLYDAPVPKDNEAASLRAASIHSQLVNKRPTIKFDSQDVVHQYNRPGTGTSQAIHEHRAALGSPAPGVYPPLPPKSPQPAEGKLLEIESPESDTPITNVAVLGDDSQTTIITPHLERSLSNEVHSAPPTMYARFRSPPSAPARKDSREIFEDVRSSGTLLSFPSVTDSARSEGWDDEELERQKESARAKERGRSARKYPKGDGDDDREESVSLWRRATMSDEDEPPLPAGGIRLVQQPSRNNMGP